MPEQSTNEVAVIERALPILSSLPQILKGHMASRSAATHAVNALVTKCQGIPKMTAELDEECKNLIIKVNATIEKMEGNRKPGTQMMTEMAGMFTREEGALKKAIEPLQNFRNQRAREVIEENKRLEREAQLLADKAKEVADVTAHYMRSIQNCLNNKLFSRKNELLNNFESLTLEDFEVRAEKLRNLLNHFPTHKLQELLSYGAPTGLRYITPAEMVDIHDKVRAEFDFETFYHTYQDELDEVKRDLVDRLPSKLNELQEKKRLADEAERQRLENERIRQQQAKEQDEQRRQQLEKQRQENERRQQETQRQQEEQQRQEQERLRQEQERLAEQQQAKQQEAEKATEVVHAGMIGNTLFDTAAAVAAKEVEGETRKTWEITVTHPAGWAELFQFWFLAKAASTPLDKFGNLKLDQIKAYAEGVADTEKIKSNYLTYKEDYKAVNRKTRTNGKS